MALWHDLCDFPFILFSLEEKKMFLSYSISSSIVILWIISLIVIIVITFPQKNFH